MKAEQLLKEFQPVTTEAWEAAIARDLKGADYSKKLLWRTQEGLLVKPYYRAEDLKGLACLDAAPGEFPFRRGARTTGNWGIREEIEAQDPEAANRDALLAITAGSDAIAFTRVSIENAAELEVLLRNLDEVPVHFAQATGKLMRLLAEQLDKRARVATISTGCNALSHLQLASEILNNSPAQFVPFSIHSEILEESGATAVEEIGIALSIGVDFLAAMDEHGIHPGRVIQALEFNFSIGENYFFEIAKLRALRMVWARAAERFGVKDNAARARIAARTSRWNKTVYDRHVNILRSTTESMAAVLGGADWVVVEPFDACCREPDEPSRRLARNTQLLLRHEAGLGCVADPAGGSYYLETLTDFLARESWKLLQQIEAQGGYCKAEAAGAIAAILDRRREAREKSIATRRRVFVGTNQFANVAEQILDNVDEDRMRTMRRGAQSFEELRLRTEWHAASGGKIPRVLLAEIGDPKLRVARSNFAASFFACAGFATVTRRFKNAEEIAAAEGDLIVLCSADSEYAAVAAELIARMQAQGNDTPVLIAGNPENAEGLRRAGIADFVHVHSNALQTLAKWQEHLEIRG